MPASGAITPASTTFVTIKGTFGCCRIVCGFRVSVHLFVLSVSVLHVSSFYDIFVMHECNLLVKTV